MIYVYVLTLRKGCLFLHMTIISITCLVKTNPNIKIVVIVDEATDFSLFPRECELLNSLGVEILIVTTGQVDPVRSSRFIKLSLPEILDSPFCYLDADTLPLVNIESVIVESDIAMVRDLNVGKASYRLDERRVIICAQMKWPAPQYPYYNSGVIFSNGTPEVKDVFCSAKELWLAVCERGFRCGDQLPLNIAIQESRKIDTRLLDDSYNAQIRAAPKLAPKAKILHIFSGSIEKHDDTVMHALVDGLRRNSILEVGLVDRLLETRNPWLRGSKQARLFPFRKLLSTLTS